MNVYDMRVDSDSEPKWIRFYTKHNLAMPAFSNERSVFFAAHPRIEVDRNTESTPRDSNARFGDYSNLSHDVHPVFSQRAKDLLTPHLQGLGQWVELVSDEAPYWLFYITNVVDALDVERSKLLFLPGGNKVMRIARHAYRPDIVRDQFLFTLPQRPGNHRLVTDRFIDFVREHNLTGFSFDLLWSAEQGPVPEGLKWYQRPYMRGLQQPDPRPLNILGTSTAEPAGQR